LAVNRVSYIHSLCTVSNLPISIDTRHAVVARAAVEAGADVVNDVSGGTFDPDMLSTVSELGVPMILMHMRGTPETMQSMTDYGNVVDVVADTLSLQSDLAAEQHNIHRWVQVVDPGIGFAKDLDGNLALLRNIATIRKRVDHLPILLGTSRKGFLGKMSGATNAADRDPGTIASCVAALCLEHNLHGMACNILRVHNVKDCKQAALVMDAIQKSS
jgi:dihydropteroate synthase